MATNVLAISEETYAFTWAFDNLCGRPNRRIMCQAVHAVSCVSVFHVFCCVLDGEGSSTG